MNGPSFNIRHGTLLHITSRPVRSKDISFLAADVELSGDDAQYSHALKEHLKGCNSSAKAIIDRNSDAPWALGRILYLFGGHLISDIKEFYSELIHNLFLQSFMAILHDEENLSIPFVCIDHFCDSHLKFSSDEELTTTTKDRIADSFWNLLLCDAGELEDYEVRLLHTKIGSGQIRYGVENGEPFICDY